ncbi:hypothetical protein Pla8534_63830 [Lignipirellula cremea]|uniref:DUF447 family protein n=1 Tax=Lignipirellula cremea TaxID=2528010 RepID=A0A518E352_9BACT|nr:hypothetical protein Pla8534_63830 [Lignipirellula cremea]
MILEGVVTTLDGQGVVNIAPMGPQVDEAMQRFTLRPFQSSQTYQNLRARPHGVLHVTDNVELLARAAINCWDEAPALLPAGGIDGFVLADACRWYAFEAVQIDDQQERTTIHCEVQSSGRLRDFFGFNRAKHAVLEAAILATRLHLLPRDEVQQDLARLETIVEKTAGPAETRAFALLRAHCQTYWDRNPLNRS